MKLGVCYYPEHWPEAWWADDARAMAELGLTWVRIGEFAWSRLEPDPGVFNWSWLDRALDILHAAGLRVVMCTPTATPPKWLVDRDPDMLALDADGRPRRFGSRRHYCFSSETYRSECARITLAVAQRYGEHPAVGAWQTDNEYGCHDTTFSYSAAAAGRFRRWLQARYGDIDALNLAWGAVFWSQTYRDFAEVDPPGATVTEANPSHRLDYNRFASDEVASFNRLQVEILRDLSPGRDILHNFMGFYTEFDHFDAARELDIAAWDSYPLGFTEQFWLPADQKRAYLRQGHPDIAAFHHDLYRACGRGRMWVMEQQPGPVNWAGFNPAPLPGMVRAWTWQALAHGAEVVSYFRWRQAPFAQEQMHAGLQRPDRSLDHGGAEARTVAEEIARLGEIAPRGRSSVALVFSYEADWMTVIQPQGRGFRWLELAFEMYSALRRLGLDVDITPPGASLEGYAAIVVPSLPAPNPDFVAALTAADGLVLLGPRTGSKTADFQIPPDLPPGTLRRLIDMRVTRVESLRPDLSETVRIGNQSFGIKAWREEIETELPAIGRFENGAPAWVRQGRIDYLGVWPGAALMDHVVADLAGRAGLETSVLAEGVRTSRRGGVAFAVNSSAAAQPAPAPEGTRFLLGQAVLPPAGVAAWREAPP